MATREQYVRLVKAVKAMNPIGSGWGLVDLVSIVEEIEKAAARKKKGKK